MGLSMYEHNLDAQHEKSMANRHLSNVVQSRLRRLGGGSDVTVSLGANQSIVFVTAHIDIHFHRREKPGSLQT